MKEYAAYKHDRFAHAGSGNAIDDSARSAMEPENPEPNRADAFHVPGRVEKELS